jgi:hypothetical protein
MTSGNNFSSRAWNRACLNLRPTEVAEESVSRFANANECVARISATISAVTARARHIIEHRAQSFTNREGPREFFVAAEEGRHFGRREPFNRRVEQIPAVRRLREQRAASDGGDSCEDNPRESAGASGVFWETGCRHII